MARKEKLLQEAILFEKGSTEKKKIFAEGKEIKVVSNTED